MKEKSTLKDVANNYLTHTKNEIGITLIALVVTIVVLLILAATSISMLTGENGIVTKAQEAKEENRGGTVEERRDLWKANQKTDESINSNTAQTLDELLADLETEGLLTSEEVAIIEDVGVITIGSHVIDFRDLIKFEIGVTGGGELYAIRGMTWEEWVESEFNILGLIVDTDRDEVIEFLTVGGRVRDDSGYVKPNQIIKEGYVYYVQPFAECVFPDSNVQVSIEGRTVLAKDIKENDDIVYYDFKENVIKLGKVSKVYIHKGATDFVKYTFEDGSYLEATDYHPIFTKEGWKSLTNRNGYKTPIIGDKVKTEKGWKKIINIQQYKGEEDCYDFEIISKDGIKINNYLANGTLVQGSY